MDNNSLRFLVFMAFNIFGLQSFCQTGVTSISGTPNQVIASSTTGAITLSLPQSLATTSNVTFNNISGTSIYSSACLADGLGLATNYIRRLWYGTLLIEPSDISNIGITFQNCSGNVSSQTSGIVDFSRFQHVINSSGSASFTTIHIRPTYGISGGTSTIRGIYYDPNIQPVGLGNADHRAIETTTGNVFFNTTSGNVNVGFTTDQNFKLAVNGTALFNGAVSAGTLSTSGTLRVGTIDPSKAADFNLAVNGSALFTKAVVQQYSIWPDYVFENDFKLQTLAELEKFIKANHHLPEIPTAKDVEKDGVDLGSNQALLLKKIEELTLLLIDQDKKMNKQNEQIISQQKDILELKQNSQKLRNK